MLAKADDGGRTSAQKAYYLICGFCRWSTRDSGIPDQRQSTGGWQELSNPHSQRISELIDSYHHLAVKEKADREWSKFVRKRNYMLLLERYPVLNPRLRRYCSSSLSTPNRDTEPEKKVCIPAAGAPSEPPVFDIEPYITQPLQLNKITTVYQRHLAPQSQPKLTAELQPHAKCLVVKRCMRCRTCEHNLSKADFNPSSIKFRINLNAMLHVPELRFMPLPSAPDGQTSDPKNTLSQQRKTSANVSSLRTQRLIHFDLAPGKTQQIVLTLCNPAHRITTVSLRQLTAEEEASCLSHLVSNAVASEIIGKGSSGDEIPESTETITPGNHSDSMAQETGDTPCFSTTKLTLPPDAIQLAPRNDIADYDDSLCLNANSAFKDNPKFIAFRRGNKVGINVGLTPLMPSKTFRPFEMPLTNSTETPDHSKSQELSHSTRMPLLAAVQLSFDYKNTTPSLLSEHRAAQAAASAAATASASVTSAVKAGKDSVEPDKALPSATAPVNVSGDQVHKIELIALLCFGEISLPLK